MMTAAPPKSINLGLGEPDFQPPDHIIAALKKAVDNGHNHYGATMGLTDLREKLVDNLKTKKPDITLDNVMVTVGATGACMLVMQTFVDDGDEVLIPNPGFVLYKPQIDFCGGKAVRYSLKQKNSFLPDIEEIKGLITSRTKAIVVNTPSNPCGSVMGREEIKAIADIADDYNLLVVSDEVYDEIIYENKHYSFLGRCDRHVYINSFSKTYAMTGWRVGYLATDEETIKQFEKIQYIDIACPPTPFQYSLIEALEG
ncbi:MAG: pyridoxal phosphate-dependent aminotransferase, partial [Thermoplasmata archaeon]|nr:pyridoxal phosphate-dependent aminotransferase [Thermoplasmata archaeon]